jgi:uncharacterized membrane protein YdbT with pleckstrin-like domain
VDELIPAIVCLGWGFWTQHYIPGIIAAVLAYLGIKSSKRAGQFMATGPGLLVYADLTAEGDFS